MSCNCHSECCECLQITHPERPHGKGRAQGNTRGRSGAMPAASTFCLGGNDEMAVRRDALQSNADLMDQRASDSRGKDSRAVRAFGDDDVSAAMFDSSSQVAAAGRPQVEAELDTGVQQQHEGGAVASSAQRGQGAEEAQAIQVCCLKPFPAWLGILQLQPFTIICSELISVECTCCKPALRCRADGEHMQQTKLKLVLVQLVEH